MIKQLVPVDLNSVLYDVEVKLSGFHESSGNAEMAAYYKTQSTKRKLAMDIFFWDEEEAAWLDYNMNTQSRTPGFYASTIMPVWVGAHDKTPEELSRVVSELKTHVKPHRLHCSVLYLNIFLYCFVS